MRRCSRCRRCLPIEQFPLRRKGGDARYSHCRDCKAAYQREWYARNGERHRAVTAANRAAQREKNKDIVRAAKNRPCADCGLRFPPYVMDFDHVRGKKVENIALLKTYASSSALVAEIAKCDVVCANCHRVRTHERRKAGASGKGDPKTAPRRKPQQPPLWWVAGGSNSEPWA